VLACVRGSHPPFRLESRSSLPLRSAPSAARIGVGYVGSVRGACGAGLSSVSLSRPIFGQTAYELYTFLGQR
jgi:hypothetical protein